MNTSRWPYYLWGALTCIYVVLKYATDMGDQSGLLGGAYMFACMAMLGSNYWRAAKPLHGALLAEEARPTCLLQLKYLGGLAPCFVLGLLKGNLPADAARVGVVRSRFLIGAVLLLASYALVLLMEPSSTVD